MILLPAADDLFIPDGDQARQWAEDELSKQAYQAAKPTWFDEWALGVVKWISELFSGKGTGDLAPVFLTIIVLVIVLALVVALLVWGRPRASRSTHRRAELLGERDDRTAAQLRAEADRATRDRDWDTAVVLRYRALARGLLERDLIDPAPGDTAQGIARQAAAPFPGFADRLHATATAFDAVRYLRTPADEEMYSLLAATDDELRTAPPLEGAQPQTVQAVPA
ncbi:DUF4129 domain-containing protein [uncultured Microbacterium sp.]|uniref:DUF4129 domain-containing protein n=1 Tax=uncultured Microbacterium sp. TaxID=191216 RepID=UPI002625348B|nr:DUF4129 domain-containing protein [uncultured Microbacterium sp.]